MYCGKAKNLKNRLRQHLFGTSHERYWKRQALRHKTTFFDYKLTEDIESALLLEKTLIDFFKPKINIVRFPVKSYSFIVIRIINYSYPNQYTYKYIIRNIY